MTRRHIPRCHDGMCGADDCPTCHPSTYSEVLAEYRRDGDPEPDDTPPDEEEQP